MKKANKFKKYVSIVTCLLLCISFFPKPVQAPANDTMIYKDIRNKQYILEKVNEIPEITLKRYPEIKELKKVVVQYIKSAENFDYTEFESYIRSTSEYKIVEEKYGEGISNDSEEDTVTNKIILNNQEITRINDLAKQIYDEYKNNNISAEDILKSLEQGDKIQLKELEASSYASSSVTYSQAVSIMAELGYYVSEYGLAKACAELAVLAGLDGPLLILDFLALVAGATIFTEYVVYNLVSNQTAVVQYMAVNYAASAQAKAAITSTDLWRNNSNNTYFRANLNYTIGIGGIVLTYPITLNYAIYVLGLRSDHDNVFTTYSGNAKIPADGASVVSFVKLDPATNTGSNNLPHWHSTIMGLQQKGHSFFLF